MTSYYEQTKADCLVSTDPALLDIGMIHDWLSKESYWSANIPLDTLKRALENTLCFGIYINHRQIGFARVVTDKATFAYLADVFILPGYRGKGYAKKLMEVIHAHPDLQGLRRWVLITRDAHSLYESFGWTRLDENVADRFMQKHDKEVYDPLRAD